MKTKFIFPYGKFTIVFDRGEVRTVIHKQINTTALQISGAAILSKYLFQHPNDVKEEFARDFAKLAKSL